MCPVCGAGETRILWRASLPPQIDFTEFSYVGSKKHHGQVVQCDQCTHRFVHPLPVDSRRMYAQVVDEYYAKTEAQRRRTFGEFLDLKEQFAPARGKLLDVGCNTGIFLEIARERGYQGEGIELSDWAAGLARQRGFAVQQMPLEDIDGAGVFDVITAFDVLEHLADPLCALAAAHRLLRSGGCLVATVPDLDAWHARLLGRHHWLVVLMHFQYFTQKTLDRMVAHARYSRIKIVEAPPYRARIVDAARYAQDNALLRLPFAVLSRLPFVKHAEITLKASLFCVAWK